MGTTIIPAKPLFDVQGNLNLHGRSSLYLPWKAYTDLTLTTQVDISGWTLWFEVDGILRQQFVVDPDDAMGLLLSINDLEGAGLTITPPNFTLYAIVDLTAGARKRVRGSGKVVVYGFEDQPG